MGKRKRQQCNSQKQGHEAKGNGGKAVRAAEKNRVATDSFANEIASAAIQKYHEVVKFCKFRFQQTVMSAFVVRYRDPCPKDRDRFSMTVVSLGVGTKFLSKTLIEEDVGGLRVKDLHGEVLAHRAFKAFLYRQIKHCIQARDSIIFEPFLDEDVSLICFAPMCKLKEDVTFHFLHLLATVWQRLLEKIRKVVEAHLPNAAKERHSSG